MKLARFLIDNGACKLSCNRYWALWALGTGAINCPAVCVWRKTLLPQVDWLKVVIYQQHSRREQDPRCAVRYSL